MELGVFTGVTKTAELSITKSCEALIISSTLDPQGFTNETITLYIERPNRGNVFLATAVKLIDFINLTNFHAEAVQSNSSFQTIALCQIGADGAVQLNEGDILKAKLENLKSQHTYVINTVEDFISTNNAFSFERKSIPADMTVQTLSVENSVLGSLNLPASLKEISFIHANGSRKKMTPFELVTESRDLDPVYAVNNDGTVSQGLLTRVVFPLVGIVAIEILKDSGDIIELFVKNPLNTSTVA